MKTWFALILTKAELDAGKPVCWVDLDAMGAGAMLQRLELLGVTHTQIHDSFHYIEPTEMLDPHKISELQTLIHNQGVRMFVIDAFNPILNLHGLDPNSNTDIETFWRTIAAPIAQAGAAPVLLDHVVKNADNRGKYSTGSERKASGVDGVHLGFKLLEPLRKGGTGRTLLSVHKDRPGYLPRPALGRLILDATGDHITYQIEPDQSHSEDGRFRPTVLMEKVSTYLELSGTSATGSEIEKSVTGNAKALRTAIETSSKTATSPAAKEPKEPSSTPHPALPRSRRTTPIQFVLSSSSVRPQPQVRRVRPFVLPLRGDEDDLLRPGDELESSNPLSEGDPIPEYEHPLPDDSVYDPYNFPPEKLQAYARTIARTKHMAGHEDRREDLISYLIETGLELAVKYDPDRTTNTGTYTFSSWLYDILERRSNDFFRKQSEGYADNRKAWDRQPKHAHAPTDPDLLKFTAETDALEHLISDNQRTRFEQAAARQGLSLADWVLTTLDTAAA
jgi:hypothetical protein